MKVENSYDLIFATGNKGKFVMCENTLRSRGMDNQINLIMQNMELLEIQSNSIAEISMFKAKQAWEKLKRPVIVHDSGLNIPAFNGFPGPYTKYVTDYIGAQGYVDLLKDKSDKRLIFCNCITFVDETGQTTQFMDDTGDNMYVANYVSSTKRHDQWSELWQVIIPKGFGYNKTLSEMNDFEFIEYQEKRTECGTDGAYHAFFSFLEEKIEGTRTEKYEIAR